MEKTTIESQIKDKFNDTSTTLQSLTFFRGLVTKIK